MVRLRQRGGKMVALVGELGDLRSSAFRHHNQAFAFFGDIGEHCPRFGEVAGQGIAFCGQFGNRRLIAVAGTFELTELLVEVGQHRHGITVALVEVGQFSVPRRQIGGHPSTVMLQCSNSSFPLRQAVAGGYQSNGGCNEPSDADKSRAGGKHLVVALNSLGNDTGFGADNNLPVAERAVGQTANESTRCRHDRRSDDERTRLAHETSAGTLPGPIGPILVICAPLLLIPVRDGCPHEVAPGA